MPRLVDYASRFEFLRQACFALVRDRGVESLTRRALAAELGCGVNTVRRLVDPSVELVVLAADEVWTRRCRGRWGARRSPDADPLEVARALVRRVLPMDESRVDEELVWLKLVAACRLRPSGLEARGRVRHDFQMAQRGWADDDLEVEGLVAASESARPVQPETASRRAALERYAGLREDELGSVSTTILDGLGVREPRADAHLTMLLPEGSG